jgi:hypothetical protein
VAGYRAPNHAFPGSPALAVVRLIPEKSVVRSYLRAAAASEQQPVQRASLTAHTVRMLELERDTAGVR